MKKMLGLLFAVVVLASGCGKGPLDLAEPAALETKRNKVAVVTGIAFPSNINYQLGFECGVNYVNAAEGRHQLSPETIVKMDTGYGLVAKGTILPASHSNAMTPENFEGLPK